MGRALSPLMAGVGGALEGALLPWDLKNFAGVCLVRVVSKDDPSLCSQSDIERHKSSTKTVMTLTLLNNHKAKQHIIWIKQSPTHNISQNLPLNFFSPEHVHHR
jgi:hypothetical protein